MSMYNRYYFTKKVYPNHLVIVKRKGKFYSYGKDRRILSYVGFKNKISLLKKKKVNYLILEDLEIIEKEESEINNLNRYVYLSYVEEVVDNIKENLIMRL